MNAHRAINMVLRLLMRHGLKFLTRGQKTDPRAAEAAKKMKMGRRIGRM
jgi:hypothetical protein